MTADPADGESTDFRSVQSFEHLIELFWSNDRYDEFHISASVRVNENGAFAPAVRLFTVLRDIHSNPFLFLARAKRRDQRYRLENHERYDHAINNGREYRDHLNTELLWIAEQCAVCRPVPDFLRQHPGEQRSHRSANSVRRDHVER